MNKKSYTYIRIFSILQLCITFPLISWYGSYPFMGAHAELKSKILEYDYLMGHIPEGSGLNIDEEARFKRNRQKFEQLPELYRKRLQEDLKTLHEKRDQSFQDKLWRSFSLFFYDLPLFKLAWIAFSILIPLMLLMRVEGAVAAVWILPLIVGIYALDNRLNGSPVRPPADYAMYPTEETLLQDYVKELLKEQIWDQHTQLLKGWQLYLIQEWLEEKPSSNPEIYKNQVERGEFAFNVERLMQHRVAVADYSPKEWRHKVALLLLGAYFFWNFLFAFQVTRWNREQFASLTQ